MQVCECTAGVYLKFGEVFPSFSVIIVTYLLLKACTTLFVLNTHIYILNLLFYYNFIIKLFLFIYLLLLYILYILYTCQHYLLSHSFACRDNWLLKILKSETTAHHHLTHSLNSSLQE
jgi:hypothetical protein